MQHTSKPAPDVPKWSALLVEAVNKPGLIMEAYCAFHDDCASGTGRSRNIFQRVSYHSNQRLSQRFDKVQMVTRKKLSPRANQDRPTWILPCDQRHFLKTFHLSRR